MEYKEIDERNCFDSNGTMYISSLEQKNGKDGPLNTSFDSYPFNFEKN